MIDVIRDPQLINPDGTPVQQLPHGVTFRDSPTHSDGRGTVCELFDPRWGWHDAPLVFSYMYTIRPGMITGWGMHMEHEDRYFTIFGELEIVMYDDRPDSPTRGLVATVVLSEYRRRIMNIPIGIWHANHNIGTKDAVVINFPTKAYDHTTPDKYRLPLDTDKIPYRFPQRQGW